MSTRVRTGATLASDAAGAGAATSRASQPARNAPTSTAASVPAMAQRTGPSVVSRRHHGCGVSS